MKSTMRVYCLIQNIKNYGKPFFLYGINASKRYTLDFQKQMEHTTKKYEANVPKFNGNSDEDYNMWSLIVEVFLDSRELLDA